MDRRRAYRRYLKALDSAGKRMVLVPYYGGKVRMSRRLLPLMPPLPAYVEPFGGSAAVLLNRPRVEREVYVDLNKPIAMLVRDMRDNAERLIWELRYTPYSRRGYGEAKERLRADAAAERAASQGVAADADVAFRQGMNGADSAWGVNRTAQRQSGETKHSRPVIDAGGQGVAADAATAAAQGINSNAQSGWRHGTVGIRDWADGRQSEHITGAGVTANREGVSADGYETATNGIAGRLTRAESDWRKRVMPRPADGVEREGVSVNDANRQGLATDAAETLSAGRNGHDATGVKHGFGKRSDGHMNEASITAERQGIAADGAISHDQAFQGGGLDNPQWNPSKSGETIGVITEDSIAKRQGIGAAADAYRIATSERFSKTIGAGWRNSRTVGGATAAATAAAREGISPDASETQTRALYGKDDFGVSKSAPPVSGTLKAEAQATREGVGVDAYETRAHGHAGLDSGFGTGKTFVVPDGNNGQAPSGSQANRVGIAVDVNTFSVQKINGQPNASWRYSGKTDGGELVDCAGTDANRQGIAPAAYESGEHGYAGKDGFGVGQSAHKRDDGGASEHAHIAANRQGVDAYESLDHSHLGMAGGVGLVRTPDRAHGRGGQTTPTHSTAARQGVSADASEVRQNSLFGAGGGFGVHNHWSPPQPRTKSYAAANRQGVNGRDSDTVLPPGWDKKPAGYVIPFSGAAAVETLLSYPPTKCETVNDADGTIYRLFKAARDYPDMLLANGAADCETVREAVACADEVLAHPHLTGVDRLYAWRALSTTFYGRMLWRLKRAQVEDKPDGEIRESYAHPTSAILESPADAGGGHYLGYCLPMAKTPLYKIGERLAGVEVHRGDALRAIERFADDPDCLIYADPPYLHSTRRGSGDYEFEMTDSQHSEMLDMVRGAAAHILISGYASPLYDDALADWDKRQWEVNSSAAVGKNGRGMDDGRSRRVETVWANYDLDLADWREYQSALF